MSHIMGKSVFYICKNKDADQLCSNCTDDQRLYFCIRDRKIFSLLKSEISSFEPSSMTVQAWLCWTWSETLRTGFLMSGLKMTFTDKY